MLRVNSHAYMHRHAKNVYTKHMLKIYVKYKKYKRHMKVCKLGYGLMLYVKYFLLCGHLLRSSDLRFIRFLLMSILYFSHKHRLHVILPGLYGCACVINFQLVYN